LSWYCSEQVQVFIEMETGSVEGNTDLTEAVLSSDAESVKILLGGGADINARRHDGKSPLNVASWLGFTDNVRILLDHDADIDSRDNEGRTPLYNAVLGKHHDVVTLLVSAGADVHLQDNNGFPPLTVASHKGHIDCVKLLVESGAEVETRQNDGVTPLYWAASKGYIAVVQFLIEQHADVNACDSEGRSCLWAAAFTGHTDVVSALVSAGADVNLQENDGSSPLTVASRERHIDCVKLLVESGAEVDTRTNDGETPLYLAAGEGHIDVVQFLIEQRADVNASDSEGQSCLWTAAFDGHTDVVRALVSAGANVNLQKNNGSSPLTVASLEGHIDCVKLLLESGAEVDTRTNDGETPLYLATGEGHIEVVQFLIEQHADVNASDSEGQSCLWTAAFTGHIDVVRALVSAGADVHLQKNNGSSPLTVASQEGHIDCVKLLLESGAGVETRNNNGATPLHLAARKGHIKVVQFLIEQRADVSACDSEGRSCLLTAAFYGHTDVVRELVSAGADVHLQTNNGSSPLSAASYQGHTDTVVMLLDSGADAEMRDSDGRTALWLAALYGQMDVLNILIARPANDGASDNRLQSPICEAAMYELLNVVKRLTEHKILISGKEDSCQNPLSYVTASVKRVVKTMLQLLMKKRVCVGGMKDFEDTKALMVYGVDNVSMSVECGADIYARSVDNLQAIDIASYCGDVDVLRFLCGCALRVNSLNSLEHFHCYSMSASCPVSSICTDHNCNTAVHLSTDIRCMRSLLENGADIEAENVDGLRPIHYAVRTGLVELVELLIQHGANVDAADVYGNRPLHDSVYHGLNVVQSLIHNGATVNVQNVDGKTPLHIAIERQQSEVVKFLLDAGADVGLSDVWRNTPLHYLTAGQLQFDELEECVVKQRNKCRHLLIRNAVGVTALSSVAAHGILDYAYRQREISNADRVANQEDLHSEQLTHAFSSSVISCLPELKTKVYSCEVSAHADCYGNTPLHYAVGVYAHLKLYRISTDVENTVEFLMKRGADINAQNNNGHTPLHVARGIEAIETCVQHADDQSFTITDKRGRNFWHLLFLFGNQSEIKFARNIPPTVFASDAKYSSDDLNRTPLHYVCMQRNTWIGTDGWDSLAEEFIQKFSDKHINKQDSFGRTALHYAAMAGDTELMKLLKTNKADDTIRDNFDYTANEYEDICDHYTANISLLRLADTLNFVLRNFHLMSLCVQQYFSHIHLHVKRSKVELRKIICDLRADNATSYVLNIHKGCRLDYSDVCRKRAALKQSFQKRVELSDNANESAKQTMFKAIQSQVAEAVQCLAKEISDKDTRFACEVVPVGSAREGVKIGCCDEFDYNFVLTDLSRICTVCYSPESPPGFVLLKASVLEYDEDLFDSNGILNTRIVKFKFETLVKQILSSLSFCEASGFEFIDPVHGFFVPPGTTSVKVNTQIKLEFTKPVNGYHVPHNISVDIVPALRINGWWPDDTRRKDLCQADDCLIVFTQPQVKYPWIGWTQPHGFITFAPAESRLLRDCPRVIRAAFKVVKRMSKNFCRYTFFSSHVIKTALLWCMDEMEPTSKRSSFNYSDEYNGDELLLWVQKILQRLLCFAAQDYFPFYFMPKCCQPVWMKERYLKQFHMHLYQHGIRTYTDLLSLNEQQSRDYWLKSIKYMFICSHLMYWTVLSDDDELKLFVPFTINPLMESDVCTTLLPEN